MHAASRRGGPPQELRYREPSRFPGIDIDLSLSLAEGVTFGSLQPAWAQVDPALLSEVTLVDTFSLGGQRSMTLRFGFSSREKTLSKEEVQPVVDGIVAQLAPLGAKLRA